MATVASIVVNLTASTSRFEKALGGAQRLTKNFVKGTRAITRDLDEIARYGKKAALGLAALGLATTKVVKVAADHEESMLRVKAVSRATVAEYNALSKAALNLSTSTRHSLSSIGEGMKFLAMAGFQANQIIEMMPTVTKMATAGAIDMASAADITTNIVAGYGMEVKDLDRATDVLVASFTGANIDLLLLGETFKHVGPVAKSAGVEFEEVAASAALLGNAGIQGSIAGTSLKSAFSRLLSPSASAARVLRRLGVETTTSEGKLRNFADIIEDLNTSGATTANILSIFGLRAGPSMARLVDIGGDALREFTKRLKESQGIAAQIESEQMQSFNAQLQLTKNRISALSVEIGNDLLPYIKTLNYFVSDVVEGWRDMDDAQKQNIIRIGIVGAAILSLIAVFGLVMGALSIVVKGLTVLGLILGFVTSGPVLAILAIATAVGFLKKAWDEDMGGIQDKTKIVLDKIQEYFWKFHTWWNGVPAVTEEGITSGFEKDIPGFKHKLLEGWEWTINVAGDAWKWITETTWAEKWQDIKGWLTDGWHWTINKVGEGWDWFTNLEVVQKSLAKLKGYWLNFYYWWNGVPAITPEGITSGFDVDQPGFKHKLLEIQKAISDLWERPFEKLEMSVPELLVTAGAATLAAVALWKVLPWVYPGLSMAITKGIGSLAAGGLMLGKVLVAGLILSLLAGAIGWAFGDKEGREGFVAAIKESVDSMTFDDPISIPIAVMDIFTLTFDFGADGIRNLREQVQGAIDQIKAWDPAETDAPEWLSDIGGSLWGLALSLSEFMTEGLLLTFDLYELMVRAIEKALLKLFQPFINFGKSIGQWIVDGILGILPEWAKNWLGIETKTPEPGTMPPAAVAPPGVDIVTGGAPVAIRQITEQERQMLAAIAYLEDGVNGVQAMTADIEVIFNRMDMNPAQYGATIEEVIRKAGQFEPVGRGLFDTLLASGNIPDEAFEAVEQALLNMANNTQLVADALYFANLDIVRQRHEAAMAAGNTYAGSWMLDPSKMEPVLVIGDTTYGKKGPNYGKYSSGTPWTGWGALDEVAGLVHKQEAVIPWHVLRKGGLAVLEFLGLPGFATGKKVNIPGFSKAQDTVLDMETLFNNLTDALLTGIAKMFEIILGAIETIATAIVGEEKAAEIKAKFEEFQKGIQDFVSTLQTGLTPPPKPDPEPTTWKDYGRQVVDTLEDAILSGIPQLKNAIDTYKATLEDTGDPISAWIAAIMNFTMSSETFRNALNALAAPVAIVAEVFGLLLMPVLEMLFPILKLFGMAITKVALILGKAWNALAKAINWALGWLGVNIPAIDTDKIEENYKKLAGLDWDDLIEGANDTSEALRNVPQGLKIMSNRLEAAGYSVPGVQAMASEQHEPGGVEVHNHFHGNVYGMDDFNRMVNEAIARATRRNTMATYGV
jgi:TP901 family phage tail tape measure protein